MIQHQAGSKQRRADAGFTDIQAGQRPSADRGHGSQPTRPLFENGDVPRIGKLRHQFGKRQHRAPAPCVNVPRADPFADVMRAEPHDPLPVGLNLPYRAEGIGKPVSGLTIVRGWLPIVCRKEGLRKPASQLRKAASVAVNVAFTAPTVGNRRCGWGSRQRAIIETNFGSIGLGYKDGCVSRLHPFCFAIIRTAPGWQRGQWPGLSGSAGRRGVRPAACPRTGSLAASASPS